ncbi:MAG: GntR family transcriptional regulator [Nitrospinota bacterium]
MSPSSLKPLRKQLLSENVVGAIRAAILEGELELGTRLVESELAERLGVSRGPVREAIRLLAMEGLVVINVHQGTFVAKPTAADVKEMYTLREALEELALRRFVELATDMEIHSLEESVERLRAASRQKKLTQRAEVDMEFHSRLFRLARHKRLAQTWSTLESQLRLCSLLELEWTQENAHEVVEEHSKIVKAIKDRDLDSARRLMSRHIKNSAALVVRSLPTPTEENPPA